MRMDSLSNACSRGRAIPVVPVLLNTYYPPNQITARRCHDIGRALRASIEASPLPLKVAVAASGGLSHFIVDDVLDRRVLDACAQGRADAALNPAGRAQLWFFGDSQLDHGGRLWSKGLRLTGRNITRCAARRRGPDRASRSRPGRSKRNNRFGRSTCSHVSLRSCASDFVEDPYPIYRTLCERLAGVSRRDHWTAGLFHATTTSRASCSTRRHSPRPRETRSSIRRCVWARRSARWTRRDTTNCGASSCGASPRSASMRCCRRCALTCDACSVNCKPHRRCDVVADIGRPVLYGALGRMLGLDDEGADAAVDLAKDLFNAGLGPTRLAADAGRISRRVRFSGRADRKAQGRPRRRSSFRC